MDRDIIGSQVRSTDEVEETEEHSDQSLAGQDEHEYGAEDCYEDCIKLFRYEDREKPECARSCGVAAS